MSSIRFGRNKKNQQDSNQFLVSLSNKMADCDIANNIEKILHRSIRTQLSLVKYLNSTLNPQSIVIKIIAIKLR